MNQFRKGQRVLVPSGGKLEPATVASVVWILRNSYPRANFLRDYQRVRVLMDSFQAFEVSFDAEEVQPAQN